MKMSYSINGFHWFWGDGGRGGDEEGRVKLDLGCCDASEYYFS